jgi:hypothetical protein
VDGQFDARLCLANVHLIRISVRRPNGTYAKGPGFTVPLEPTADGRGERRGTPVALRDEALPMRQMLQDESAELYARAKLSAVCRVVADRLSAAADEAARGAAGGRPGRVPFEHMVAIAANLYAAEKRLLPRMRADDDSMLSNNRDAAQAAIERGLVAAMTAGTAGASCEHSGAEPTLEQTEKEVRLFTRDFLHLLKLRLVTVPRLGGGARASGVVAAMPARTQACNEYLVPLRYTAPVKLSLRRLLERDQAEREAAAASWGTAPPAFNALLAVLVLFFAGLVYYTAYKSSSMILVNNRLLPAPAGDPLSQLALHLIAVAFSTYFLYQLPSFPILLGLVHVDEGAASSSHGSLWQRLRDSHSNIVRLKLYFLVATMCRLPQPLERQLSSIQSACEVQFCIWLRRLALARMREALHRKSIGAHEAQMLFLDLHAAAQVRAQAGGTARPGVSRKSRVHHPQAPRPKAHHAPGVRAAGGREASEEAGGSGGEARWSPSSECETVELELPGTEAEVDAFLMLPVVQDTAEDANERSVARLLSGGVGRGAALLGKGEGTWKAAHPRLCYAGGVGEGGEREAYNDVAGGSEWGGDEEGLGEQGGGGRGGSGSGENESGPHASFAAPARRQERGAGSHPRLVIDLLREGGWTCFRARRHLIFKRTVSTGKAQTFRMASTPSDCRAPRAQLAQLRKLDAEAEEARAAEGGGAGGAAGGADCGGTATGGCGAAARATGASITDDAGSQKKRRKGKAVQR